MDRYHERDYRRLEPIKVIGSHQVIVVLDGQQRLTALNIGLRGWYADKLPNYRWSSDHAFPERRLYLNLLAFPGHDTEFAYEFKMLQDKDVLTRDHSKFWFLVSDMV